MLRETINKAEELNQQASVGTGIGQYPKEAKVRFEQAILEAKKIESESNNQPEIDQATSKLIEAIEVFKAAQIVNEMEDINQDGKIDVADLALAAYYYKATPIDSNWDKAQKADINQDNLVDIIDLGLIANQVLK